MKLLIVSATPQEIQPFANHFNLTDNSGKVENISLKLFVSGVGMVATAFSLGGLFAAEKFDLAINAGIAGAFDRSLEIGETIAVASDQFAELGAEDGDDFISIDKLGFGKGVFHPSINASFNPVLQSLKSVSSITVNKVHGNDMSIASTVSRFNPQIENMEGAAFFYACSQIGLPCMQLRSISNYVERRNRESWNIPLAIKNLNQTLIEIINKLQ